MWAFKDRESCLGDSVLLFVAFFYENFTAIHANLKVWTPKNGDYYVKFTHLVNKLKVVLMYKFSPGSLLRIVNQTLSIFTTFLLH